MPKSAFPDDKTKFPKVLVFDTSGPFVAVGTTTEGYSSGKVLDMAKGQAESLFPLIQEHLTACGWTLGDIDVIGVATGPGNFTGIRISVSAARGLGLALGIPVFALSQFELAYDDTPIPCGILVSLPAPRDMAYVQGFSTDVANVTAQLIDPAQPPSVLQLTFGMTVHGHRAREIAAHFEATAREETYKPRPDRMAELAEQKYFDATAFPPSPVPNYVKPPDAAPARDTPPRILQ